MEISMIPFGLLSGFMDSREIRITKIGEKGFHFRVAEACQKPEEFLICFYDMKKAGYQKIRICRFVMEETEERRASSGERFYWEYSVKVEQKDFEEEVLRLAGEYSRYIRLKLEDDDSELAKALTGYPAELDGDYCNSLEEQSVCVKQQSMDIDIETGLMDCEEKNICISEEKINPGLWGKKVAVCTENLYENMEFALELNRASLYEEYLRRPLKDFLEFYKERNPFSQTRFFQMISKKVPDRFYIGNQFCHYQFPSEEQLFSIMGKMYAEGLEVTLAFSYIREFMFPFVEKLLGKVDNWCLSQGCCVEILVNDWAMAEMLRGKTERLKPSFGTLLNKRKKDPRMVYKSGDLSLFSQNSLNADFYRKFLKQEFGICRYEWETCGYQQEFPPGKNSLHLPFYQTNTSQYCPLYALCTTGERGKQKLPEDCPKFCEKCALLYPGHLHMAGRFNSLFGIDETLLRDPGSWKDMKSMAPDRLVVNI